jgi:hypothetical protein
MVLVEFLVARVDAVKEHSLSLLRGDRESSPQGILTETRVDLFVAREQLAAGLIVHAMRPPRQPLHLSSDRRLRAPEAAGFTMQEAPRHQRDVTFFRFFMRNRYR